MLLNVDNIKDCMILAVSSLRILHTIQCKGKIKKIVYHFLTKGVMWGQKIESTQFYLTHPVLSTHSYWQKIQKQLTDWICVTLIGKGCVKQAYSCQSKLANIANFIGRFNLFVLLDTAKTSSLFANHSLNKFVFGHMSLINPKSEHVT